MIYFHRFRFIVSGCCMISSGSVRKSALTLVVKKLLRCWYTG
jgi:hypothetical protein